jgi:hypothetical protein
MNTLEQIIEIIKVNKKPYLYLRMKRDTFNEVHVGAYECADCLPDDTLEAKTEKALSWLMSYLKSFPEDMVFSIIIKTSEKANGSGVLGPIYFMVANNNKVQPVQEQLSGLGAVPMIMQMKQLGYLSEGEVNSMILRKELEFRDERERMEREKLEAKFNDQLEAHKIAATRWSPKSMKELAANIAGIIGMVTGKPLPSGLLGAEKEEPVDDTKKLAINSFAEELTELSIPEIEALKNIIIAKKQKVREEQAEQN